MTGHCRRALREWRRHPDRGVSLMEVAVVMFVMGIVLVGVVSFTTGVERSDGESVDRVDATEEARYAMQRMSSTIRHAVVPGSLGGVGAAAVVRADPSALTFYANLDNPDNTIGPSRVEYALADGVLTQVVRRPVAGTRDTYCTDGQTTGPCAGRTSTLVLGRDVLEPLFSYLDADGAPTTVPARVRTVEVSVAVQADPTSDRAAVRVEDRIVLFGLN